ncbi:MAG TPA: TetR/AcrR family transcriptional regulator [Limnobacter sp.]|nr:TetR/AcrR family transcriptional regulator [Limnobacter sp.]
MIRKPKQNRSQNTVETIVQGAFIALAKHGAEGATTRRIADCAGVGVGSIYEYFENKEAILGAMGERFAKELVALIHSTTQSIVRLSIRDAVYELITQTADFLKKNDELYLKCARESALMEKHVPFGQVYRALMDLFVQHAIQHPEMLKLNNLQAVAYIFINSGMATMIRYLNHPNPSFSFDVLAQGLADMAGHYVEKELSKQQADSANLQVV